MDPGRDHRGDTALVEAIEANHVDFLLAMGRAGGGEERRDGRVHWIIGGSPVGYHNCVVRADLAPDEADAAIISSRDLMRQKGVPGSWHVGTSMRPDDLGERLRSHGFRGAPEPGMAAGLSDIPDTGPVAGLTIERVTTEPGLDAYEGVLAAGFGEGPVEAAWVRAMFGRIGLTDDNPWRHYLARLGSEPVATATLFLAAGVAGLYFVCTAPGLRGRGIGAATSRAAMIAARDLGFATAVLGSSPMGHRIYQGLGFRDLCSVDVYEWTPV